MIGWILGMFVVALLGLLILWFRHVPRDVDAEY